MLKNFTYAALIAAAAVAIALGSATPGQAKAKKKMAAPPAQPVLCFNSYEPVCGVKGGQKFTYANTCSAYKDGANVVAHKACSVKKAHKAKKKM